MTSNPMDQPDSAQDAGHIFQDSDCSSGSPSLNYSLASSKGPSVAEESDIEVGLDGGVKYGGEDHDNDISTIGSHSVFKDTVAKRKKNPNVKATHPPQSVTTVSKQTSKEATKEEPSTAVKSSRKADPPAPIARHPSSQNRPIINRYQPASLLPDDEVTTNSKTEEENDQDLLPTDPRLLKIASAAARMGASSPSRTNARDKALEEEVPHDEPFLDDDNLLPSWGVGSNDPHRWDILNIGLSPNKLVAGDEVTVSSMGQHSVVSDFRRAEAEKTKPAATDKATKDEELVSKNDPQNTTRSTHMDSLDGQDGARGDEGRSALPAHTGKLLIAVAMLLFSIVFVMIGVYFVNGGFGDSDDDSSDSETNAVLDFSSDDEVWREWMERRNHTYPGEN